MNSILLFGIIIWIYMLSVLKRAKLTAFSFIVGSVGFFFILMAMSTPYWIWFFTHAVINGVAGLGKLGHMCQVYLKYGLVYISNQYSPVTMQIDYECSGIIETMAYISLLAFYPTYSRKEKVFYLLMGMLWIYLANVLRLMMVIVMVHFGGAGLFYLSHSILGRIVFYLLVIILYYNVFTYSRLSRGLYKIFKERIRRA
ncbi:exosortase family protein XrtG [Companilactobacillus zhachilii]|jgi:exosortase family protein|uniref:exosortase family protein XrtG n=1 Tax=Companilactobacillus zhachilii TaxID=2304606 RepID=UPI004033B5A0